MAETTPTGQPAPPVPEVPSSESTDWRSLADQQGAPKKPSRDGPSLSASDFAELSASEEELSDVPAGVNWTAILRLLADFRQAALLNYGEMNAVKVVNFHTSAGQRNIEPEFLSAVGAIFAPPKEFEDLYKRLCGSTPILVLVLEPDTGRKMTAYAMLDRLLRDGIIGEAHELVWESFRDFRSSSASHRSTCGYLLQLPEDEEEGGLQVAVGFGGSLHKLSENLAQQRSRLIILTNPAQWARIGLGAPDGIAQSYEPPAAASIAAKWLSAELPLPIVDQWIGHPDIQRLLEGDKPLGALETVDLILSAQRAEVESLPGTPSQRLVAPLAGVSDDQFERRVLSVVSARRDWRRELLAWHREQGRTGFERNFLVAASVLRAAPVAHVYAKAAMLCKELDGQSLRIIGQEVAGVLELVDTARGHLRDGVIVFDRPGWDDAALEYFWDDRPLARQPFLKWLAEAPVQQVKGVVEPLTPADREALAERISGFALRWAVRHRRREPLESLANSWSKDARRRQWDVLVALLDAASVADTNARYIHEVLLTWAKSSNPALQKAVAALCAGEFGRSHPDKAIRRLAYVGQSHDPDVALYVARAVANLWSFASVRKPLLHWVMTWCSDPEGDQLAGHLAFAILASTPRHEEPQVPRLLETTADYSAAPEALATGWRALLDYAAVNDVAISQLSTVTEIPSQESPDSPEDKDAEEQQPKDVREVIGSIARLWFNSALSQERTRPTVIDTLRLAVPGGEPSGVRARFELLRYFLSSWLEQMTDGDALTEARIRVYTPLSELLDRDLKARMGDEERAEESMVIPPSDQPAQPSE